jgi:hypothetical protein
MVWQPKDQFLPKEARGPDWKARWKSISDAPAPSGSSAAKACGDEQKYFVARGSFRSPVEIPPHYRYFDAEFPDAGTSELKRNYERIDCGFVVEHRWQETLTDIVSLHSFVNARDELLDFYLPIYIDGIEKVIGKDYDVSRFVDHLRTKGRRFVENVCLAVYDAMVRGEAMGNDGSLNVQLANQLRDEAEKVGLDTQLLQKMFAIPPNEPQSMESAKTLFSRLVIQFFRHRDGSAVTAAEAEALIQSIFNNNRYEKAFEEYLKPIEARFGTDKEHNRRVKRAFLCVTGLYFPLRFPLFTGAPEFEFSLRLPGELIETNGLITRDHGTRWKFRGEEAFPSGYAMRARSIAIDRDGQKKHLGKVVVDDERKALEFIEIVGRDGPLVAGVRDFARTGNRSAIRSIKGRTSDESERALKILKLLLNE